MITSIIATNSQGEQFYFDKENRIVNGFDLSGLEAKVNRTQRASGGSLYQNTILEERELAFELQLRRNDSTEQDMDSRRARMYSVFSPLKNPIRFDFKDSIGNEYYLTAYLLSAPTMKPDKKNYNPGFQRALLEFVCPDPHIYQKTETRLEIATFRGGLEFIWEIPTEGDVFEERTDSLEGSIFFTGSGPDGMVIRFIASGTVVNPILTNARTFERIKLNTTMENGDVITINTYTGERNITRLRGGVTENLFYTLDLSDSSFLQLKPGDNSFVYGADSGENLLQVVLEYRIRLVGV